MTKINLAEIEARAEKATKGPWYAGEDYEGSVVCDYDEALKSFRPIVSTDYKADAQFIAHAREDVPALIAEVKDMQKYADIYRTAFWKAVKHADLDYADYLPEEAN